MPSDRIVPLFICADCGRTLTLRRGKWAHTEPDNTGWNPNGRYVFTCRHHIRAKPDGSVVLEAADYHYVAGETQRHWTPSGPRRD